MYRKSLDFETRSACDLLNEGGYRYAYDPTTQAICCSFMEPSGVKSWWPEWVSRAIDEAPEQAPYEGEQGIYQAWNSQFDRLIWQLVAENDYEFPRTTIEDWICTASLARANGLPGKLEDAARALQITQQKDTRGKELIKLLSIPIGGSRENPIFNEDPALLREMIEYCEQDVRTEHEMVQHMRGFLDHELEEFWASEYINDRGINIDVAFCKKAITYGDMERGVLEEQLAEVTKGEVERPSQYQRVKAWLLHGYEAVEDGKGPRYVKCDLPMGEPNWRVNEDVVKMMTVYKKGERKMSLDKNVRHNILQMYDEDPEIMTPEALEVIEITDLAGRSSVAKYKKMANRELDGRIHGAFMFNGAKSTGRFSSQGAQLHNFVRDCVDDFDEALAKLDAMEDTEVIHTLSKMLRPTLRGVHLHWSDWSNVEGRGLPYLADDREADKKLDLFRHCDTHPDEPDVYERMAASMGYDDRQIGKVLELSMNFGGGVGAGQAMARNYGVSMSDAQMKVGQKKWRATNQWAEPYWYKLKDAAWNAVLYPGKMYPAGRVTYFSTEKTHNSLDTLWCQLPSGRLLSYVKPRFESVPCPWDEEQTMTELTCIKANFKPKAGETDWPRYKLWYGVLTENVTQAFCADLLRYKLVEFKNAGLNVVAHTHDEIVVEDERDVSEQVQRIMQVPPPWAEGLPLVADINRGYRYSK